MSIYRMFVTKIRLMTLNIMYVMQGQLEITGTRGPGDIIFL